MEELYYNSAKYIGKYSENCMYALFMANKVMESYNEFDEMNFLFEAKDEELKNQLVQKNKDTVKTSKNWFLKAIDAIVAMLTNIYNGITDFIRKMTMSKADKEAYENFKKACAKDPSLKNKKILVKDYKAIMKEYNRVLENAENTQRRLKAGEQVEIDEAINEMEHFITDVVKGAGISVAADIALKYASSSMDGARTIANQLKKDSSLFKEMKKEIGLLETMKFKAQINSLTKQHSLQRSIMRMKGEVCDSLEESIKSTFNSINDMCGVIKEVADRDNEHKLKSLAKLDSSSKRMIARLAGNKSVQKAMPTPGEIISGKAHATKHLVDEKINDYKARQYTKNKQKAEAKGQTHYQSKMDSVFGKNKKVPNPEDEGLV